MKTLGVDIGKNVPIKAVCTSTGGFTALYSAIYTLVAYFRYPSFSSEAALFEGFVP